jgi:hypothetical protein
LFKVNKGVALANMVIMGFNPWKDDGDILRTVCPAHIIHHIGRACSAFIIGFFAPWVKTMVIKYSGPIVPCKETTHIKCCRAIIFDFINQSSNKKIKTIGYVGCSVKCTY